MNIQDAKATDLTDTAGACAILKCSSETIRKHVMKGTLRCFHFQGGVLVERSTEGKTRGRDTLFLRDDVEAMPRPEPVGWKPGRPRKERA